MPRTIEQEREVFKLKAGQVRDQKHFDKIMELFPVELRDEIYAEIKPLLKVDLKLTNGPKDQP